MELISNTLIKTPLHHLRAAVTADCQQQYKTAVMEYMDGAPSLLQLAKEEELSLQTKQLLKIKCQQYLDRIQLIKSHLDAGDEVPPNTAADRAHPCTDNLKGDFKDFIRSLTYVPFEFDIEEVKGATQSKEFLKKNVILPLMFPGLPDGVTRVKKGILLYGLPGTGKTMLLSTIAAAVSCPFFRVASYELCGRWLGTEHAIQRVKDLFSFVCQNTPCILCLDDLEGLYSSCQKTDSLAANVREELNTQLMALPADSKVTVMAATQTPWVLGGMLRRRFERRFYMTLPTELERKQICIQALAKVNHKLTDDDLCRLGHMTSGYTGADLGGLISSCCMAPIRRLQTATHFCKVAPGSSEVNQGKDAQVMMMPCEANTPGAIKITWEFLNPERMQVPPVTMAIVEEELMKSGPSISAQCVQKMDQWHEEFGQEC